MNIYPTEEQKQKLSNLTKQVVIIMCAIGYGVFYFPPMAGLQE